jgi:SAM-dependent methyltransferase
MGTYYRWLLSEPLGLLPEPHERVLDIGCHDGYFLSQIDCRLKVAVDLAPHQVTFYPVWPTDGRFLPFADEAFDRVYLLDVIEHVMDYGKMLIEAVRVLRPDGILWISTPSLYWWVVPPFLTWVLDRHWEHVRRGHTIGDIQSFMPPTCRVRSTFWNMPYFRTFYFPIRVLWGLWPALGKWLLTWVARRDQRSPSGRHGHLFINVTKTL